MPVEGLWVWLREEVALGLVSWLGEEVWYWLREVVVLELDNWLGESDEERDWEQPHLHEPAARLFGQKY
jgi:hypothetical protein